MNCNQAHSDDLGFDSEGIHLMASIKYWALLDEASKSMSFSKVRKHFMNVKAKTAKDRLTAIESMNGFSSGTS